MLLKHYILRTLSDGRMARFLSPFISRTSIFSTNYDILLPLIRLLIHHIDGFVANCPKRRFSAILHEDRKQKISITFMDS